MGVGVGEWRAGGGRGGRSIYLVSAAVGKCPI